MLFTNTPATAEASSASRAELSKLLLGKDVKALLDMPAYKDGIDLYVNPKDSKRFDERGIDLKELSKFLKEKGVGVERDEWATVTNLKVDSDRVEVHLGGGGEGGGASKRAAKKGAGYKRAGGTRINFRYGRDIEDADLAPATFLPVLARVLDTSRVQEKLTVDSMPNDMREAIQKKSVVEGMTYQMVLLSAGDPDQKKVDDAASDDVLRETWYYLKDGHRWVVRFENGKVMKYQIYQWRVVSRITIPVTWKPGFPDTPVPCGRCKSRLGSRVYRNLYPSSARLAVSARHHLRPAVSRT